ncbi:MAG: hypothetical protein ABJC79_13585 [Acidimicrobiia bacterium]
MVLVEEPVVDPAVAAYLPLVVDVVEVLVGAAVAAVESVLVVAVVAGLVALVLALADVDVAMNAPRVAVATRLITRVATLDR